LPDEATLELVDQSEDAAVVVGERLLADDRDQVPQLAAAPGAPIDSGSPRHERSV
jgi:hypothetical protein